MVLLNSIIAEKINLFVSLDHESVEMMYARRITLVLPSIMGGQKVVIGLSGEYTFGLNSSRMEIAPR